jgi:hypothetical protein
MNLRFAPTWERIIRSETIPKRHQLSRFVRGLWEKYLCLFTETRRDYGMGIRGYEHETKVHLLPLTNSVA